MAYKRLVVVPPNRKAEAPGGGPARIDEMDPLHFSKGIGGEDLAAPRGQEAELPRGKAGQIERRGGVPRGGSNALGLIEGERLAVAVAVGLPDPDVTVMSSMPMNSSLPNALIVIILIWTSG